MLPLFGLFFSEIWVNRLGKRTVMYLEGLTVLDFDNNSSNSAQGSSHTKISNESSDDFSANKPSSSKKMAQNVMFHVHMAPEEVF